MVTVRSAKKKGSGMEYNIQESLRAVYPDILLTKELGYQLGYDLVSNKAEMAIEAKFHRTLTWTQAKKLWIKLKVNASEMKDHYLIFKTNFQPVLVMSQHPIDGRICVREFEDVFEVPFIVRGKKK